MAGAGKAWRVEYAKTGKAYCRTCKKRIAMEVLRFGKMVQSRRFDGFMAMWNHATCVMKKKSNRLKSIDDIEGLESLRWEDQEKIRKYVNDKNIARAASPSVSYAVETSQTSRATCKSCSIKIIKGEVRVSVKTVGRGAKGLAWHHGICFLESFPSIPLVDLSVWESLSPSDQASVLSAAKAAPTSTECGLNNSGDSLKDSEAKWGTKRKRAAGGSGQHFKSLKTGHHDQHVEVEEAKEKNELEFQTRVLWALKDDLKKYVSIAELRDMLKANDQGTSGSELDLRDRCADGMMFGALQRCPTCSGYLHYSGGTYRCHGYLSEWTKCSYSTSQPDVRGKWEIPKETENIYLLEWFKSQLAAKPVRILTPSSSGMSGGDQSTGDLGDLRVAISGLPSETVEKYRSKIEGAGGQVHVEITKDTNCLVMDKWFFDEMTIRARRKKIPIVKEDYLVNCIKQQKKLPFNLYKIEPNGQSVVTVKVKGNSAVHEFSGLQDYGHILEDGDSIYNTTLSMSDISSGINSYYILQIIEDDNAPRCYVFRKWGRVGDERIGDNRLEKMSKSDAIDKFKWLFREKTGNPWEAWVHKQNFKKHPGRFFPLDIDYGISKQDPEQILNEADSELAPALKQLIKMLFDVEAYRATMREFQIKLSEMPLGKLSKSNIQKGFEALTHIQNLVDNTDLEPTIKESLIVDASNRFFTVIPSINPHVIKAEEDFKSKMKMLEALQNIVIASDLAGFDSDSNSNETLDDKYKKLCCNIVPLPHDSEDYRLIEKYLVTTHAPTHTGWNLELEDVFSLEREGESDAFAPHREKLGNRMLLWHGSRLTNFLGILSQGLRIAPPQAPSSGYMFGKGVYFADLASKSAQYCHTNRKNPVGLMLLSEVALGNLHELTTAQYMDNPPEGKHSTKGLGRKVPNRKEFANWRDGVVVPCGKPVDSKVKTANLMYNEYIVYNTAQVKMQFLLKVRFHYKR